LSAWNQAKYETLWYISELGVASGLDLSILRDVTHGCQSTLLKRYYDFGLLSRYRGEGKTFLYTLDDNGEDRLEWLEPQFSEQYVVLGTRLLRRCKVLRTDYESLFKDIVRCKVEKNDSDFYELTKRMVRCHVRRS
jgi:hypothetical protein